ncbi:tetratricopeptide repeat protein [Pantanalinema sp. GBBB05]|uniref:tetratricopeptide repeat protein n=1 Tax=Pantanalinema sp. GBBB05 TaxID=2604139 RepID=UPI001D74E582|nr:tetratricopeptide repeat protein [Pantanalinema sp. GBBB05]
MNPRTSPGQNHNAKRSYRSLISLSAMTGASSKRSLRSGMARSGAMSSLTGEENAYLSSLDRSALLRQSALELAQRKQYAKAIALFNVLIDTDLGNASDYNNRGLIHFQSGNPVRALADYNHALRLNPRLAKVYNNRANCYAALGQLEAALLDYEMAIDLNPTDIRARINQGITFRDLALYDQAIESLDLSLQLIELLEGSKHLEESVSPLEGHVYAERGRTHHLAGDWNCAVADYHRALAHLPITKTQIDLSYRLRQQVVGWLEELLAPLFAENSDLD